MFGFGTESLHAHCRGLIVGLFVMILYWLKEIMEYILRVIFGVDRRMMYVPVPQNAHVDMPFLGNSQVNQRTELVYYVYHATISIALGIGGYMLGLYGEESEAPS